MTLLERLDIDREKLEKSLEDIFLEDMDLGKNSSLLPILKELVKARGKRLRPALLITGALFGPDNDENINGIYRAAAVIEAIHLSSLIHDDIIDRSVTRRSRPSLNKELGSGRAVFAGSYIFTRAVELMTEYTERSNHEKINDGMRMMCLGELDQIENRFDFGTDIRKYIKKSEAKTARLISACLYTGAMMAKADKAVVAKLEKIGMEIGIAFQIVDDILDFTQSDEVLGKPAGNDLQNGNITLPVIYAIEEIKAALPSIMRDPKKEDLLKAVDIIKGSDAIKKSYDLCSRFIEKARRRLGQIRGSEAAKKHLETIIEYIVAREY
jgi:heptaprenyl diphosphate synthase